MTTNYLERYFGHTLKVNKDVSRPKSRWIDWVEEDARKLVAEIGGRLPRMEVAGDIFLRRPRPTQGCEAENDDILIFKFLDGKLEDKRFCTE
jgi:hypothetical protein